MADTTDVVVIGGGIVGTSVLHHLAERGRTDAVLLEQGQLAGGSTSRAIGGVRNVFSHPRTIAAGTHALEFYGRFEDRVGIELPVERTGYLYLARSPEAETELAGRHRRCQEHGLDTRLVDPGTAVDLLPLLDGSTIERAFYAPDCIHIDPHTATQGFAKRATELGATVRTGTTVRELRARDGAVGEVVTDNGSFDAEHVVVAAGPWTPELAASVGIEVPIDRTARRIGVTEPLDVGSGPLVIDPDLACYFRTEPNGAMLFCDMDGDVPDASPDAAADTVETAYYRQALTKIERIVPSIVDAGIADGWAGVQTATPDGHPILGPTRLDGLMLACGFCGLGVIQAPSVGAALADLVVDGTTDRFDVGEFGVDRFAAPEADRIEPERLA